MNKLEDGIKEFHVQVKTIMKKFDVQSYSDLPMSGKVEIFDSFDTNVWEVYLNSDEMTEVFKAHINRLVSVNDLKLGDKCYFEEDESTYNLC